MRKFTFGTLSVVALVVAVLVVGVSTLNAIRTNSLDPIWTIAWLPAILVGVLYRPASGKRCARRILRRPQS